MIYKPTGNLRAIRILWVTRRSKIRSDISASISKMP